MSPNDAAARALAVRLRELRQQGWPEVRVTQRLLARALRISEPLVSSWESLRELKTPPEERLRDYARFFATPRSVAGGRSALVQDFTDAENARRDELERELLDMRAAIVGPPVGHVAPSTPSTSVVTAPASAGPWHFADGAPVTIVCASLPERLRADESYTNPNSPDYVELYSYADLDALVELHGHVWAANPDGQVNYRRVEDQADLDRDSLVTRDDLTTHLVLLGGVDWNPFTREVLAALKVPVIQETREVDHDAGAFYVVDGDKRRPLRPVLRNEGDRRILVEDVTQFVRGPNPYNRKRTVTVCNGMFGRGTYGAVRALTDAKFRDRNADYIRTRFGGGTAFGILARVRVVLGEVITPDWSEPDNILHEWSEPRP